MNETTTNEMVQEDVWTKEEYQDTLSEKGSDGLHKVHELCP